jgi:hypothetical protein
MMNVVGSLLVIAALATVHVTIGKWRWLHGTTHSPWLSVSAGTALAYVFAHLLPKLASTQEKLIAVLSQFWDPVLYNQTYLIALIGFVVFFWVGWIDNQTERSEAAEPVRRRRLLVLHIGGYGMYYLQIGLLIAELPRPDAVSYVLAGAVLSLHFMGVDHILRNSDPLSYDRWLRWIFTAALVIGWALGVTTTSLNTLFMLLSAFIAGGIIVTAIREELPSDKGTRFLPFALGVLGSSLAIVALGVIQRG